LSIQLAAGHRRAERARHNRQPATASAFFRLSTSLICLRRGDRQNKICTETFLLQSFVAARVRSTVKPCG
jgi:hypothetical protein